MKTPTIIHTLCMAFLAMTMCLTAQDDRRPVTIEYPHIVTPLGEGERSLEMASTIGVLSEDGAALTAWYPDAIFQKATDGTAENLTFTLPPSGGFNIKGSTDLSTWTEVLPSSETINSDGTVTVAVPGLGSSGFFAVFPIQRNVEGADDFYIIGIGQSNTSGQGGDWYRFGNNNEHIIPRDGSGRVEVFNNEWKLPSLINSLSPPYYISSLIASNERRNVRMLNRAVGGSSISTWVPGGSNWNTFVSALNTSEAPKIDVVVWIQGENETAFDFTKEQYATELQRVIDGLKALPQWTEESKFIAGEVGWRRFFIEDGYDPTPINEALRLLDSDGDPQTLYVKSGHAPFTDGIHYGVQGIASIGRKFYERLISPAESVDPANSGSTRGFSAPIIPLGVKGGAFRSPTTMWNDNSAISFREATLLRRSITQGLKTRSWLPSVILDIQPSLYDDPGTTATEHAENVSLENEIEVGADTTLDVDTFGSSFYNFAELANSYVQTSASATGQYYTFGGVFTKNANADFFLLSDQDDGSGNDNRLAVGASSDNNIRLFARSGQGLADNQFVSDYIAEDNAVFSLIVVVKGQEFTLYLNGCRIKTTRPNFVKTNIMNGLTFGDIPGVSGGNSGGSLYAGFMADTDYGDKEVLSLHLSWVDTIPALKNTTALVNTVSEDFRTDW